MIGHGSSSVYTLGCLWLSASHMYHWPIQSIRADTCQSVCGWHLWVAVTCSVLQSIASWPEKGARIQVLIVYGCDLKHFAWKTMVCNGAAVMVLIQSRQLSVRFLTERRTKTTSHRRRHDATRRISMRNLMDSFHRPRQTALKP